MGPERTADACPSPPGRHRRVAGRHAGVFVVALLLAACDTGDGKTLKDPVGTVAPPTTVVPSTLLDVDPGALEDLGVAGTEAVSLPAEDVGDVVFRLRTPWVDGAPLDRRYTCDGENVSPPLSWTAPPAGTVELALAVVDESITNGPPFVHWVVAGIDPATRSLTEGTVPAGAVQALNFFGDVGWGGPCPPPADTPHSYRFTLYALNQQVELADGTPATDLLDFVETVAVASTDAVGTFRR